MVLVDTDVLVDCLRGTPPAKAWLERASTEVLGIPGVVAMELLIGCRNRAEIEKLQKFLIGLFSLGNTYGLWNRRCIPCSKGACGSGAFGLY